MTGSTTAFTGALIHDGFALLEDHSAMITPDGRLQVRSREDLPEGCEIHDLSGGLIAPGFVDLQVNGGGGVMFNDAQTVEILRTIAQAHRSTGTVAILPTLITDTYENTRAAIDAVEQAIREEVPGIIGIHLEGPHLSVARKGAHDPSLIRPMEEADLNLLLSAANRLPNVMVTVAPETTSNTQIAAMTQAGIAVSLGHTDADFDTCMAAFDAGASCVTHLFNAMSQLGSREPGLVGAALARDDVYAGLIADGIHVHPAMMQIALRAKQNPEKIFLVTDAMAPAGTAIKEFTLNGRQVIRRGHQLTLSDGTLAGADLDFPRAISVLTGSVHAPLDQTVARATSIPASLLREPGRLGTLSEDPGQVIYLKDNHQVAFLSDLIG